MRIISKFHDYYDTALAHGLDPDRLYRRSPCRIQIRRSNWPGNPAVFPLTMPNPEYRPTLVNSLTLGFCGRHYPVWTQADWPFSEESLTENSKSKRWLTLDAAIAVRIEVERDHDQPRKTYPDADEKVRRRLTQHEHAIRNVPEDPRPFRALDCPIYVMLGTEPRWGDPLEELQVITNPRLANLGFERLCDAYSAFQTIAGYLANELAQPDGAPTTTGGDEVVARAHGFDEQSFRNTSPGPKKLNRRANRERKKSD